MELSREQTNKIIFWRIHTVWRIKYEDRKDMRVTEILMRNDKEGEINKLINERN